MMRSPIPVLDAHGHLRLRVRFPYKTEPEQMLEVMDALNIEALAVTASLACWNDAPNGNIEVDEMLRKHGNRFRGYITVNPHVPGEALRDIWAIDIDKGGNAIPYYLEDPFLRTEFEERMAREGTVSRMESRLYEGPPADGCVVQGSMTSTQPRR